MPGPIIAVDVACAISAAVTYALRSANSPAQKAIAPAASACAASCGPGQGSPHFIVLPTSWVDRDRLLSKTCECTSMAATRGQTDAQFFRHPCRKVYRGGITHPLPKGPFDDGVAEHVADRLVSSRMERGHRGGRDGGAALLRSRSRGVPAVGRTRQRLGRALSTSRRKSR